MDLFQKTLTVLGMSRILIVIVSSKEPLVTFVTLKLLNFQMLSYFMIFLVPPRSESFWTICTSVILNTFVNPQVVEETTLEFEYFSTVFIRTLVFVWDFFRFIFSFRNHNFFFNSFTIFGWPTLSSYSHVL